MRLSGSEREIIVSAVREFDAEAEVWLFGSRVDDGKRGGDIDLAIKSARLGRMDTMRLRSRLEDELGEQKIDLVVSVDGAEPFFRLALEKGVRLDG